MDTLRAAYAQVKEWLYALLHWVEAWAHHPYGSWALFGIAFAESSFFPIPPDVLLIPLCLGDPSRALWFATICSAGSVLGGIAGYGIGYYGGRPLVYKLFPDEKVKAVERYYDKYNAWATFIAGLTPLPYKIFTISGGACAINFKVFVFASVLSRSLRFFAVATLIYFFGEPIQAFIEEYLDVLSIAFVVLLIGGFWLAGRGLGKAGKSGGGVAEGAGCAAEPIPAEEADAEARAAAAPER
ncbi:MAG TPA: VTT domain-containing protein [Thermoanaerobaculia bacterium]|nr:VTT domain-containing protein [Thermoanaerobaculia bacterium]